MNARFPCRKFIVSTFAALAGLPLLAAPAELTGVRAPAATPCPSPGEAMKKMAVPDGYEVRCFAHEPMVINPVGMSWDERGRLWVVELYEYPEGAKVPLPFSTPAENDSYRPVPENCRGKNESTPAGIPRDRIVILEDSDGDGVADKRTVFVEGLSLASAVLCGDGGIYVGQTPHVLHLRDTDGDGHADEWKVVLTGFGREDTHEMLNSFAWGPDGWLYFTHGVFTHSKVRRPGEPEEKGFVFNAGIGRVKISRGADGPGAEKFEVFADGTSNPWGVDFDAAGNAFIEACVIDHLFHMAPGGMYQRRGGAPKYPFAYELLPSIVNHKHFRAAYAGIQIYNGGRFPDAAGHLFFGNIHDNSVHEEKIEPRGATFEALQVRDFIRGNDGWFRPVSVQTGPDGVLWVMDWCDKYPCYQNAKANPGGVDREKGRIWRIVHSETEKTPAPRTDFAKADLVSLLSSPNNWVQRTAARLLIERGTAHTGALEKLARDAKSPGGARIAALSILNTGGWLRDEKLASFSADADPVVRAWAARLAGERGGEKIPAWLVTLAGDKEPSVRLSVAAAARQISAGSLTENKAVQPRPDLKPLLAEIIAATPDADRTIAFLVWTALEPQLATAPGEWLPWLAGLSGKSPNFCEKLAWKSARRLCDTRDGKALDAMMDFIAAENLDGRAAFLALDGLIEGQGGGIVRPTGDASAAIARICTLSGRTHGYRARKLAALWGDTAATDEIAAELNDAQKSAGDRTEALAVLRKSRSEPARKAYSALVARDLAAETLPDSLRLEILRAGPDLGGDDFPAAVVAAWKSFDIAPRVAAAEALLSRTAWAAKLLDAVEQGTIERGSLPPTLARSFASHRDAELRARAEKMLGRFRESSGGIKDQIASKRAACLDGTPDREKGRAIFQAMCAVCHAFYGGGQHVGPDLIGSGRSNLDALLANVIDPDQIIGNGYENVIVTTKDGRTLTGRMTEDSPALVKLLGIGGQEQTVPRDQVANVEKTKSSVMPSTFGQLPDEQFRDLVWFLLAPPDEGPLTPQKKSELSRKLE